ncbi:hypothetical protein TWF730_003125 [Orbilia blumenaviensis]|uniref:Uncharacterized protein n=1 Tax=Orbilia blumenaviensis TaxID=1796055 RepID=A0AAV9U8S7_9PEZI
MSCQSTYSTSESEQSARENSISHPSINSVEMPRSKRIIFSELEHNIGIENTMSSVDSSDSSCSTLSLNEGQEKSAGPALGKVHGIPHITNATKYVRSHLQSRVFCNNTEMSFNSSNPSSSITTGLLEDLAKDYKFPSWKLNSIKEGGSLRVFGNNDSAPLSDVYGPLESQTKTEKIDSTPRPFKCSPNSWKFSSADKDCFVFLEVTRGVPPESAVWTDEHHGSTLNPTKWVSFTPNQRTVYHYSSHSPVADKFFPVVPNYLCHDSQRSAASILVQRKIHNHPGKNIGADLMVLNCSRPADGMDLGISCSLHGNSSLTPDHEFTVAKPKDSDVPAVALREPPSSYTRFTNYDGPDDEKSLKSRQLFSSSTKIPEEDIRKLPVFERSQYTGIRVIYAARDPDTNDRVYLVDHVQEEDERYRYARDTLARSREEGLDVDSIMIDCPTVKLGDLKARLHLAYDNLQQRMDFLIREGKFNPPAATPNTKAKKPTSLRVGSSDGLHGGFDGPSNGKAPFEPETTHIPTIHGGNCGSAPSSPRPRRFPLIEELTAQQPTEGFFCRSFKIDGDMIEISGEFGFVHVRAGGRKFHYPFNTFPHVEDVIGELCVPEGQQMPPVMKKLLRVPEMREVVEQALSSIWEFGPDPTASSSSYFSGTEISLPEPMSPLVREIRRPAPRRRAETPSVERGGGDRVYSAEEWSEVVAGFCSFEEPVSKPLEKERVRSEGEWKWVEEEDVRGKGNPLCKPVCLGDAKPLERKENLVKKLVTPKSDVKALLGGEKENSSEQETKVTRELLEAVSSMRDELRRLGQEREEDRRVIADQGVELIRLTERVSHLEREVEMLRDRVRMQEWEGAFSYWVEEGEEAQELGQWDPARGQRDLLGEEDVDLIKFDDPSDLEEVLPAEDGGSDKRVAVVSEWEPLVPIPDDTTQLIVVATETGAAAGILERVRKNVGLCRQLVYVEVRGGQLDIEDDDFCQLVKLCPDLVGVAVRGGVNLTDVSMLCVLTSCRMICGIEISGQPSTPGKISSRPLQGIRYAWQGCSLREVVLRHQPAVEEEEVRRLVEKKLPWVRLRLAWGGQESMVDVEGRGSGGLERWVSLRGELWMGEKEFMEGQEGIWEGVRSGVARSKVFSLLTQKREKGGLVWMLDDYQMEGVRRVNLW